MKNLSSSLAVILFLALIPLITKAANPLNVVINEIAWMGTEVSSNDEWIELYNNTDSPLPLEGWVFGTIDGTPEINLVGRILANSFYLLERTDDNTLPNIPADQIYTGALENGGESLELYDNFGNLIDSVNCSLGWLAGDNQTKQTMGRKNSLLESDFNNWGTSQSSEGTPKAKNSILTKTISSKVEKPQTEKGLVAAGEQIPETPNSLFLLSVALTLAIFSGIIILILKKKIKKSYNKSV